MSKIYLQYIDSYLHSKPGWLKLPSHDFDYKYEEHKGQIPLIIHHKE